MTARPPLPWLPAPLRRLLRPLLDPARRYRHARLIHAVRVALGLLASIALTTGMHIPHGEWASITLLVVVGGLQHQGNIRRKAAERGFGTLIGAAVGLVIIVQQSYLQVPLLSYGLIAIACAVCAYYAIGKGGYIALLSAITIFIVAGHGENAIADGLWRTVDVLIGIVVALLFSFALPLHATYTWRYQLAEALRSCARMHTAIALDAQLDPAALQRAMALQGSLLVQLRALMPSVAKETDISMAQLETIQHGLRVCISLLEVLAAIRPRQQDGDDAAAVRRQLAAEARRLQAMLVGMARALSHGVVSRLAVRGAAALDPHDIPAPWAGYVSLTLLLEKEFSELGKALAEVSGKWNI
ncbi:FUSC family protein [Cupriavidus sp. 30B13]|uniref:FUSC family protein n=1 Tax=Cupriavidus sp. 30B13 TaxID=3384241 RepID=UPI003B91D585